MQVSFQLQSNTQGTNNKEITNSFLKELALFKEGTLSLLSDILNENISKKLKLRVYQCKELS